MTEQCVNDASEAYERASCGLLTLGADGTIERVNRTMCVWTGFRVEELVARRFADLLSVGSRLFHHTHWLPLMEMQGSVAEVQLELVVRKSDVPEVLPVLVNAVRRDDLRVDVSVFVAADRRKYERELLLARRRAEELLAREREAQEGRARAEARLRLALESANLRVWNVELPSGVRRYERDVARLIGDPELPEVTAEIYGACIHPDDRAQEAAALAAALQGHDLAVEYRLLGRDGVERRVRSTGRAFFDEQGRPVEFSGVLDDVTDRRRAEEALRQREDEFRTLAENSPDIIARFDLARRFVYVSPAVERLTGRSGLEYLGKGIDELELPSETKREWSFAVERAFRGHDITHPIRYESLDGVLRELEARVVPERNRGGEIASVLMLTRDVTLLKAQEREAQQRAVLAEQLIGIVSHDLRNPLNAILLGTQLLGAANLGPQARVVRRIATAAQRASRLISDLLDFTQARLGGGLPVKVEDVDLHAVIAECVEELRLAWSGRAIEHRRIGEGTSIADPDRVVQIVTNLVNNAIAYGTPDEPVSITSAIAESGVEIIVHNSGRPIPEALQAHMFEPLRRGDDQVQRGSRSVGLGLYIVREIAQAHAGRVTVRSSAAEGTTFRVELPRTAHHA